MNDSTPEDDEPTTYVENSKNLFRKHTPKVLAVGGVFGSVALAVIAASLAGGRDSENAEDQESLSAAAQRAPGLSAGPTWAAD